MTDEVPRDPLVRVDGTRHEDADLWRTAAQVDIDRIWYSAEFRRLGGVTQVVPPQEDFGFHDRLIHSVKVAQVAATLARKLLRSRDRELVAALAQYHIELEDWIHPDHCYVAGLAHDIGHPPFGHAGEQSIQAFLGSPLGLRGAELSASADLGRRSFEGNAQSTRIVVSTSFRKKDEVGLNLTLRSLAAITKYPWLKGQHPEGVGKLANKWSFYETEKTPLDRLIQRGFIARTTERRSIEGGEVGDTREHVLRVFRWPEAEVMDWADDISYAVHDLEDFYRFGRIPLHRLRTALKRADSALFSDADRIKTWDTSTFEFAADDHEVQGALTFAREKMRRAIDDTGASLREYVPKAFARLNDLIEKMPTNRFDGTRGVHERLQNFASEAITTLIAGARAEVIVTDAGPRVRVVVDPVIRLIAEFFKALCHYYVINTSAVAAMQQGQQRISAVLVLELVRMAESGTLEREPNSLGRTLPARLRAYLDNMLPALTIRDVRLALERSQSNEPRDVTEYGSVLFGVHVAVVDFLCGLKDAQAARLAGQLTGTSGTLSLRGEWLDS